MTDPFAGLPRRSRRAPAGALDAVVARGRARRRRAVTGLAGTLSLVLLTGVLAVLSAPDDDRHGLDVADDPTPSASATATASEEPSPSASAEPTASPTPSASPSDPASAEPSGDPSPSPEDPMDYWARTHRDGQPGWSGPYGGCGRSRHYDDGRRLPPGVTVRVYLPKQTWRPGDWLYAEIVITNGSEIVFREDGYEGGLVRGLLLDPSGEPTSYGYSSDALVPQTIRVDPGETRRARLSVWTGICGDGNGDPTGALPAGDYRLSVRFAGWQGEAPAPVRLHPGARPETTWVEEPLGPPYEEGTDCTTDAPAPAEADPGLTFEPAATTVAAGDTLDGTLVFRNTGGEVVELEVARDVDPRVLRGLDGAQATALSVPPDRPDEESWSDYQARRDRYRVLPGETLRFPASIPVVGCPGDGAVAPGPYDVVAGLGHPDGPAIFAAPVRVTVTAS